jgi:hypothetical protein
MNRLRRPITLLSILLASGGLAACGNHRDEDARVVHIEGEGLYLPVGDMKYQVQGSRQLNPSDTQDKALLAGLPASQRELKANEVWFGIFLQVENEGSRAERPSGDIEISDTQDQVFRPIAFDASNPFAYRPADPIPAGEVIPLKNTPGYDDPVRGALVLFKLNLAALDNRPLEMKIEGTGLPQQTGIITLDV